MQGTSGIQRGKRALGTMLLVLGVAVLAPAAGIGAHADGGHIKIGSPLSAGGCVWDPQCNAFRTCQPDVRPKADDLTASVLDVTHLRGKTRTYRAIGTQLYTNADARTAAEFYNDSCGLISGGIEMSPGLVLGQSRSLQIPSAAKWILVYARNSQDVTWSLT